MNDPYEVAPDIHILPSYVSIPGVAILPNNAFLVLGSEPMLIDTGLRVESGLFMRALASLVRPADIRYVMLTHDDTDHSGNLDTVLRAAPRAELLVHGLGALRSKMTFDIALERVHAIAAGDQLGIGGRTYRVFRPPLFDNPTTLGLYDPAGRVMFSVDTFGALLPKWLDWANGYPEEQLNRAMLAWASFDDPWVRHYERAVYAGMLEQTRSLVSELVLSSHLPPARGIFEQLVTALEGVPDAEPFVPPNQAAFAQLVAGMNRIAA